MPKREVGFRIQVTAANGDDEIEELIAVLTSLKERFQLHQVVRPPLSQVGAAESRSRARDSRAFARGASARPPAVR